MKDITSSELLQVLKSKVQYLLKKWFTLFAITLCFGIIGFAYKYYVGPEFKASLSFVSENSSGDPISAYSGIASQFGIDLGGGIGGVFEGDNLLELFKSKALIKRTLLSTVDKNKPNELLIHLYIDVHKIKNTRKVNGIDQPINFSNTSSVIDERAKDSIIDIIYNKLLVSQLGIGKKDKKNSVIYLEVKDKNETFAKAFTERLSENVIQYYTNYKTKKSSDNLSLLQNQADSLKRLLNYSISDVARSSDLNVNPIRQVLRSSTDKKRIDVSANTAMYTEILKQLAIAKISLLKETPLIQVIDYPNYPLTKVGYGKLYTAIIWAFLGFILSSIFLLIKQWIKEHKIN